MTDEFIDHEEIAAERQEMRAAMRESVQTGRGELETLRQAYAAVFSGGTPPKGALDLVLDDLGRFCRAHQAYGGDAMHLARLDGRREVFLRIMLFSRLDADALFTEYYRRANGAAQ